MARKKVAKTTKAKKPTAKNSTVSMLNTMEKDFRATPAKLSAQVRKDLAGLKQQEKKMKGELNKAQAQVKTNKKQFALLTAKNKSKPSATTKKQLAASKQNQDKFTKNLTAVTAQMNNMKQQVKTTALNLKKFAAINKTLSDFDKQWKAQANTAPVKAAAKPAVKTTKKTAKKTKTSRPHANQDNAPIHDDQEMNNMNTTPEMAE